MSRRILLGGILLALVVAIIFGVIIIRLRTYTAQDPLKAIPSDATVIIRINDYQKLVVELNQHNLLWQNLIQLPFMKETGEMVNNLDSAFLLHQDLREIIEDVSYISLHNEGDKRIAALYTFALNRSVSNKKISQMLKMIGINARKTKSRKYEGNEIIEITYPKNDKEKVLSYTITDGLLMISKSSLILEDALRQLSLTESLYENRNFLSVLQTSGKNKLANIYISPYKFNETLSYIFNENYQDIISKARSLDNWIQLDVNVDLNNFLLNGFVHQSDTIVSQSGLFSDQQPQISTADKVLPSSASMLLSFMFSNSEQLYQRILEYMSSVNKLNDYQVSLNNINDTYKTDMVKMLSEIIDNEVTIGNISDDKDQETTQLILFKVKSASLGEEEFMRLISKIARIKNINRNAYIYKYYLDNEKVYSIYKLPVKNFAGKILGSLFNCFDDQYVTFIDNFMVLAASQQVLSKTIHNYELNKTLSTNSSYQEFKKGISAKSNVLFYLSLNNSADFFERYLDEKIIKEWKNNEEIFKKVRSFGFQLGKVGQLPYCNINLKHYLTYKEKPKTVWQSLLDTTIKFKPQFVINHYTKEKEIFVQDEKNNIYLINKAGRILWKVSLSERINSEVFQIDYYKNNKLQLLFSTKNYLHLIDRNGNYVERYPVKLRAPATCGVSLFDYEGNENYRLFIACNDKQVYAYSKDGTLIKGWQFKGTDHNVYTSPKHFRVADKDFIVFGDKYKTYILDRRGNTRVSVKEFFSKSEKNDYIIENNGSIENSEILTTDTAGTIYHINFDGSVDKTFIRTFSPGHYFDFKDMDGDGKNEYIFLDNNTLEVYNQKKEKIIDYSFDSNITNEPLYFYFSYTDRKLGFVSEEANKIYLINNDGTMYEGFPLTGCTLFSIGFLDNSPQFNLIVGNNDHFLLNYAVH